MASLFAMFGIGCTLALFVFGYEIILRYHSYESTEHTIQERGIDVVQQIKDFVKNANSKDEAEILNQLEFFEHYFKKDK